MHQIKRYESKTPGTTLTSSTATSGMLPKATEERALKKAREEERKMEEHKTEVIEDGYIPCNHGKKQKQTKILQNYGMKETTCGTRIAQK